MLGKKVVIGRMRVGSLIVSRWVRERELWESSSLEERNIVRILNQSG